MPLLQLHRSLPPPPPPSSSSGDSPLSPSSRHQHYPYVTQNEAANSTNTSEIMKNNHGHYNIGSSRDNSDNNTIMALFNSIRDNINDYHNNNNNNHDYRLNSDNAFNVFNNTNITQNGDSSLTSSSSSSSSSSSTSCDGLECYPDAFFNSVTAVTIFLALVGGGGNVLTVVAILTSRLRNNINSILICNLSLADSIYCLLLLPMQATAFYIRDWTLGETMCEIYAALRIWLIGVNMTLLSCIAFYRFLHVVHTNAHTQLSQTKWFFVAVIICWAFPLFFSFTPLVGWWGTFAFQDRILQCTFDTNTNKTHKLTVITLGYVIPCVFILVCYARIGCVVFTSRKRTSRGSLYRRQRAKRESFRLTAMMVFIFLGFLMGTTPFFLINTLDKSLSHPAPHVWSPVLAWFMYSLNPVIYTVMDQQFQSAYKRLLCCQLKKGTNGSPTQDMGSYQERNSSLIKNKSTAA